MKVMWLLFVRLLLSSSYAIVHFLFAPSLCFKARLSAKPVKWKLFFILMQIKLHPRRPRGSQSGWEKGRDESFQVRAKEPLGTDSHRAVSKNSSGCRLLIGHKKCFVLFVPNRRTVSSEFLSWVRTRQLLFQSHLVWLMHQRNAGSQETFSLI